MIDHGVDLSGLCAAQAAVQGGGRSRARAKPRPPPPPPPAPATPPCSRPPRTPQRPLRPRRPPGCRSPACREDSTTLLAANGIELDGANVHHSQHRARRRPVGAVQLLVHAVRPVLRSRPRPRDKGGSGTVFIPLQPDDPLYVEGSHDQLHGADARHGHGPARTASWDTRRRRAARSTPRPPLSTRTRPIPRMRRTRCSCASMCSTPTASRSRPAS